MEREFTCCLCGKKVQGYGNNPYPLGPKDDKNAECCNACDLTLVVPARLKQLKEDKR